MATNSVMAAATLSGLRQLLRHQACLNIHTLTPELPFSPKISAANRDFTKLNLQSLIVGAYHIIAVVTCRIHHNGVQQYGSVRVLFLD
jgi:hypothetical protein